MIKSLFDRFPLLSTRLSVYIFCAALIPLLVFGCIAYRLYAKEHYANQLEHLEFVRDDRIHRISAWFEERRRDLTYFSAQIDTSIREHGGTADAVSSGSIGFATYGRTHNDIEGVLLLNGKGDVILCSRDFRDSDGNTVTNICGTPVFSEMIKHGRDELYVTGWFKSSVDGALRMYLSRCVYHGSEVVAVLAIQVNINKWVGFFENRKGLSDEEEVLVYSDDGRNQNPMYWFDEDKKSLNRGSTVFDVATLKKRFGGRAIEGVDYRGVPVVAVQAPVPFTQFTLAAKCDSAKIYRHLRWAFLGGFLTILVLMTFSAIGARLLARKITEPFRTLLRTAVEISMGNLYARTRLNRDDEIGRLADAFDTATEKVQNQMVELERLRTELRQERDELDRKVRERTEELRRANAISRAIADYTVDWELWLSPTGQLRWTNPACERVTGYTVEEMLCTPDFWRLISEGSTRRMFLTLFRAALDGMNGEKVEFRCRKKDGSLIWLRVSWQRIYDSDGTYIGMRASAHDVTDEVDQRLENQRLAEVVNQSSSAIMIRDRNGNAIYANGAFLRMFGVAPDEIVGRTRADFFSKYIDKESEKTIVEIECCIGEGRRWEGAVKNLRGNGEVFVSQTLVFPVRNEDGSIANYVESRVDITAELENKNRLRQMASAVEQCVDGVIIRNLGSGRVVYVNDAFLRITGYDREYVLQSDAPGTGPSTITNCSPGCVEVLWAKQTWREICDQTRPDGTRFKNDCTISPICDENGNVVYGLGFFRDVTKEVAVREELTMLQNAVRQSMEGVVIADLDLKVVYVNDAYERITLWKRDEAIGRTVYEENIDPEVDAALAEGFKAVSNGETWHKVYPNRRKDGVRYIEEDLISPVRNFEGRITHYAIFFRDITREAEIREELTVLQNAVRQVNEGVVIVDMTLRIIYVNDVYEKLTLRKRAEVLGKTIYDLYSGQGLDDAIAKSFETVANGKPWHNVYPAFRKDGSRYIEEVLASPVFNPEGKIVHCVISLRDVTVETEAREELRRMSTAVEQAVIAVLIRDLDGRAIYANRAYLNLFRITWDDLRGKKLGEDFMRSAESIAVRKEAAVLLSENKTWHRVYPELRKDGSRLWVSNTTSRILDPDGKFVYQLSYMTDVTQELSVRARADSLAKIVEQSQSGIVVVDRNLKILYVNEALLHIYHAERTKVEGESILDFIRFSPNRSVFSRALKKVLRGEMWQSQFQNVRADGEPFHEDVIASPVTDSDGKISQIAIYCRDVTEEVKARAEVERLGMVLNQSVTAMMIADSSARVDFANDSFFTLTGFRRDEVIGRNIQNLPFGAEFEREFADALEALKDGRPWMGYFNPSKNNGEPMTVNVFVSPVKDGAGRSSSYLMNFWDVTEEIRNRTEVSRLAQVMEQSVNSIEIKTLDLKILYVNRAYTEMTGLAKAEVIGKTAQELGLDCILPETYAEIRRTALAGETWTGRVHSCRKSGTPYIVKMSVSPVFDAQGAVMNLVVNKQDITQEVASVRTAERLREVLQQSSLAMLVTDADHRLTDVNEAFLRLHGITRDDMLGRCISEVPLPESLLALIQKAIPVLDKGDMFSGEYAVPDGKGGERICEAVVTTVFGKDGMTQYHLAIYRDISHEVETRNRMLQMVQVIEQSPYVVEVTDKDGRLIYVNSAFCMISGYSAEEVLGRFVVEVKAAAIAERDVLEEVWSTIRSGNVWHGDLPCERKNGTRFVMRSVIAPVRDGKGEIVSFVATKMDITPMVELEAQMRQAQKMESVGRLAGGIAHDFNNMLQGIMGFAELLDLDTEGNNALNANVKEIQRAAGRARDLTRQLLAFGRKQQSRPQPLDLNAHVRNMEKMLGRLLSANTPLSIDIEDGLPQIMADPGQLEQAIMNLVLNARDAVVDVNYARISITAQNCSVLPQECVGKPEMRPGHYVRVSVSDNGCGIPAELRPRIFEPFFTTKENEKGTGLGLSVAYGIMKQHNGWIGLDSIVGKGTTFSLYFPVVEGTFQSGAIPVEVCVDQQDFMGHGEFVLVVEDEDLVRDLAVQNLKRAGYEVLTAPTAPHGLKAFMQNRNKVKLLFSDIVLLDGTGIELADHIRKMVPGLPVLLTSGFSREHLDNRDLEADNYRFLPKPYTREDLLKAVAEALRLNVSANG